jgi:hypothetical protein
MGVDTIARRMWVRFEPYHDVTYFTPESRAATDALGCRGGWMGYFGMRAAPLGRVDAVTVTGIFYNFHPRMVHRAIPDAWDVAEPSRYLETRLVGADGALRRMLGDATVAGDEVAEAAELARAAAELAPTENRPMAAANAALPWPEPAHLMLWQATTVLRESRGDGHVAALRTAELGPCQALVLFAAEQGLAPEYMQKARGWTPQEWQDAAATLVVRGLLETGGAITDEGRRLRRQVELHTDEAAASPWTELGERRTARLTELLEPLARLIADGNDAMRLNPMALDARRLLAQPAAPAAP